MEGKKLEAKYKALANRRRLAILKYLLKVDKATVGQIAGEIKLLFKATSKHLQRLRQVNFISYEQIGLEFNYFITEKKDLFIKQLQTLL